MGVHLHLRARDAGRAGTTPQGGGALLCGVERAPSGTGWLPRLLTHSCATRVLSPHHVPARRARRRPGSPARPQPAHPGALRGVTLLQPTQFLLCIF